MILSTPAGDTIDTRSGYQIDHDVAIERIDNEDGTHVILVDSVQVGPPFAWDDMAVEHYVRRTVERLMRERNDEGRRRDSELTAYARGIAVSP